MTVTGGALLADRYRLTDRIATGGMGEVWRGTDELLGRAVAVKVLKAEYADDADFLERFRAEARHTAGLSHGGIANVFDYGEVAVDGQATAYLVMELVEGAPLSQLLAERAPLRPAQTLDVIGQAALALQAAHDAGVIHRDVKPGNLLVRPDGVVKVTDFGIARATDAVPLTRTGTVLGTAYYLSPEQGAGRPVTPASDVYSLGVVGYECLAGVRPFPGPNPVAVATAHQAEPPPPLPSTVPEPVRRLIGQALAKDPADRPASAGAFGRAALRLRDDLRAGEHPTVAVPVGAPPPAHTRVMPPVPPAPRTVVYDEELPPRHSRAGLWWLLALAVLIGGGVAAGVLLGGTPGSGTGPSPSPSVTASPTPKAVSVPGVVGQSQTDAEAALRDAGLKSTTRTDATSDATAGTVIDQDPPEGATVEPGAIVTLTISSKPTTVTIHASDFIGKPLDEARQALEDMDLTVETTYTDSDAEPGTVVDVMPTGQLSSGDTVTLVVAQQPSASPTPTADQQDDGGPKGKGKDDGEPGGGPGG